MDLSGRSRICGAHVTQGLGLGGQRIQNADESADELKPNRQGCSFEGSGFRASGLGFTITIIIISIIVIIITMYYYC